MRFVGPEDGARLGARSRVGISVAICLALAALVTLASSPAVRAKASTPVYFFSNNAQPINSHNRLVMRPGGFLLFLDGQWLLQDLHWTGWGSPVARATGISNSSDDIPDAASGRRIKTWADMTLSSPLRWRGREVYSCFKILVPPPASDLSGCVLPNPPIGNGWLAGGTNGVDFLAPGQRAWCVIGSSPAFCVGGVSSPAAAAPPPFGATLSGNGNVTLCSIPSSRGGCAQNWDASAPVLQVGQEVRANNVLCKSEHSGIFCSIASGAHKGRGFVINTGGARRVG
jgi:hypothetical protein